MARAPGPRPRPRAPGPGPRALGTGPRAPGPGLDFGSAPQGGLLHVQMNTTQRDRHAGGTAFQRWRRLLRMAGYTCSNSGHRLAKRALYMLKFMPPPAVVLQIAARDSHHLWDLLDCKPHFLRILFSASHHLLKLKVAGWEPHVRHLLQLLCEPSHMFKIIIRI